MFKSQGPRNSDCCTTPVSEPKIRGSGEDIFADTFPAPQFGHYTLTTEDPTYQDTLLAAVNWNVTAVMALNLNVTAFAANILRVVRTYTAAISADPTLQTKCEGAYPGIRVQSLT